MILGNLWQGIYLKYLCVRGLKEAYSIEFSFIIKFIIKRLLFFKIELK